MVNMIGLRLANSTQKGSASGWGTVELGVPGGVVDGPVAVPAAAEVPVVVLARPRRVVRAHLRVDRSDVGVGLRIALARAGAGRPQQAEVLELKAPTDGPAKGVVIEEKVEGRGWEHQL